MHNVIHKYNGNNSERCPVCNGTVSMDDTDQMTEMCNDIMKAQQTNGYMYSSKGIKAGEHVQLRPFYEFSDDTKELPKEIMLVPMGKWDTTKYGPVEITKDDCIEMKKNFDDNVRKGVMIDVDHGSSQHGDAAAGWIKKVEVRDDGLWATELEWSELGNELVKGKIYKFLSPEFDTVYVNPQDKNDIRENVLIATSLVNRPLLKEIPALTFSEDKKLTKNNSSVMIFEEQSIKPMNINDILNKKPSARTSEEMAFLETNKETMTDDQKKILASETPVADPTKKAENKETKVEATETVKISAAELKTLKEDAEAGRVAFKEVEKNKIREAVSKLKFSEAGGKLPPASVDPVVNFMIQLSEKQREEFLAIVNTLPDKKLFGEIGAETKPGATDGAVALTEEVQKYAADHKMTFTEAMDAMKKEDPKKFSEYRNNFVQE